ncbi:sigma-54 dependent transcriptional regulator [Marinomonas arenicola]|uniref:Sigma-54 dependent transcriptional regulator n=1 Tax=Marinomonas arenicola TaxID=569601 RepID=A0ABU9G560_9GAMM
MKKTLVTWVGQHDLDGALKLEHHGPIYSALSAFDFDEVVLLCNYSSQQGKSYVKWLESKLSDQTSLRLTQVTLVSPVDFSSIYVAANECLSELAQSNCELSILLSPGTPAMQAVWVLLGKTKYPAQFIQSSKEKGAELVQIPFDIAAEYTPLANVLSSTKLTQLSESFPNQSPAFSEIVTQNPLMERLKQQAQILAKHDVPVLIQGETGTGKELFARAIHNASNRADQPFVAVNCGAFPLDLIDSILFGHKKGAFTGASSDRLGVFQQANKGTLFLDEFGELEASVQVRLLRVLQEGVVTPVGATKEESVDVRLICATNKDLLQAVANGEFREDLFYRVAVGVLNLPPIKNRSGDITLLANALLTQIAKQLNPLAKNDEDKKLSPNAINLILKHSWPGNVRELHSTLLRAYLWSQGGSIDEQDLKAAMFPKQSNNNDIFSHDLSNPIDLQEILDEVEEYYLRLAWQKTLGKKTKASELLGIKSYQNYSNRLEKFKIN